MKSIHDKDFRYATAEETRAPGYLRRKFARIRAEQKQAAESQAIADAEAKAKTVSIKERKKA